MVLEATVLVIDNSEWMRNGDYPPSRLEAQTDAVTFLFNAKTQSNPENTVGLLTMAGKSPNVLVTLTSDIGKILTALHGVEHKIGGKANISTGVQIAQLVLKHRQNKNQRQRIIVFAGSPVDEDEKSLVKLGKKLKKNNVAVDVISFGEDALNQEKLEKFVESVNNNDNSHLVTIPPGPHVLSDILLTSPIIVGEDGPPPGFSSGSGFEFGVDPNLDPELALALKLSMEEEKARQEKTDASSKPATSDAKAVAPIADDEELARALAMSMGGGDGDVAMGDAEDEEIARAIALSMSGEAGSSTGAVDLSSVLGNLPGVDPNDPRIQSELEKKKKEDKK